MLRREKATGKVATRNHQMGLATAAVTGRISAAAYTVKRASEDDEAVRIAR